MHDVRRGGRLRASADARPDADLASSGIARARPFHLEYPGPYRLSTPPVVDEELAVIPQSRDATDGTAVDRRDPAGPPEELPSELSQLGISSGASQGRGGPERPAGDTIFDLAEHRAFGQKFGEDRDARANLWRQGGPLGRHVDADADVEGARVPGGWDVVEEDPAQLLGGGGAPDDQEIVRPPHGEGFRRSLTELGREGRA